MRHLDLLGLYVRDRVTEFEGVVTSISYDLFGGIQAVVAPKKDPSTKESDAGSQWFDVARLEQIESVKRAMPVPNFEEGLIAEGDKGPAFKPRR